MRNDVDGSHCLDMFAGSGALGFEALSRGAAHVTFLDTNPAIKRYLLQTLQRLNAPNAAVHSGDALQFSIDPGNPFDIVFLDPPYGENLLSQVAARLEASGWLAPHAVVYLECSSQQPLPLLPLNWQLCKSKSAGQVGYHLIRRQPPGV